MKKYYDTFLSYTLIPSVYLLVVIILLDSLGWFAVPKVVYLIFMGHFLVGVIYSMKKQNEAEEVNDA